MSRECKKLRAFLPELLAEEAPTAGRRRLEEHARACAACAVALAEMRRVVGALCEAPPLPDPAVRRREILRALNGAQPRRSRLRWWSLAAAGATAAAAFGLWLFAGMHPESDRAPLAVISGDLPVVGLDTPLAPDGPEGVGLRLADGSTLRAGAHSRFVVRRSGGWRVEMDRGELGFDVSPQPAGARFEIETAEASIRVVGTRFALTRADEAVTTVAVQEGVVEVVPRAGGRALRLGGGQTVRVGSAGLVPTEPPVPPPSERAKASTEVRAESASQVAEIRRRIRAGEIRAARSLIRRARAQAGLRRQQLAELAILDAEVLLAEKSYGPAIAAYVKVSSDYPGTPQAELGLFTAGQLTVAHGERAEGMRLLRRYLELHPRGRFREDAAQLVAAIERSGGAQ